MSHFAGPSGTTKRLRDEDAPPDTSAVKRQKKSEEHLAAGSKLTLHGNVYQLKLLTLFLKRGLDLGYSFTLATEMVAAEKFDDIVFGYTDKKSGKDVCRFLQAKHKLDETKNKITLKDLLNERDGDFSIKKYFISYCKIKRNPEFKDYDLRDFTICTNINLEEDLAKKFEDISSTEDDILHFEDHDEFRRYKINLDNLDQYPEKDKLLSVLRHSSELRRLANLLANHVLENKRLALRDLFIAYHGVLGKKVIERVKIGDVEVGKFRSEFIKGESDQSSVLGKFRESFYEEYCRISKLQMDENNFWVKMKETNLKISSSFGNEFELNPNPELTADKEALAEEIVKAIIKADQNIVKILKDRRKKSGIIIDNIDKLAGHVFVKKEDVFVKKKDKSKEFYFNSKFLDENEKLPCHLEEFRTKFVEKLKGEGIEFSKMNEYKFCIASYLTCEEGQLDMKPSLPDDYYDDAEIIEFLKKFVLSVKQPNEKELGYIIEEEIAEIGKDFKLINCEFMAGDLQMKMLNWMEDKRGKFLTNEWGNAFLKKIKQNVSQLVLIGPTLLYRSMMKQFDISFRKDLATLKDFLKSEKRIFNLVSSCDDTTLSSIKVLQTLNNLPEGSYIFMCLDSLLCIQGRVMDAFRSETCNLLAIQCTAKTNKGFRELCDQLSALLESNDKKKKVILITLENDKLAKKFKTESANNHYEEINDKKIDLTDLSDESQGTILTERKVTFLGKEVNLNAVVDDTESKKLLSGEVLSMLIKNDKLELGKPPIDPEHSEVEDYFTDRVLIRYEMVRSDFMNGKNFLVLNDQNLNRTVELFDYVKREIESCSGSYTDIILISDSCDEFIKLSDKYRKNHSIHWLKKEEGKNDGYIYKWQQSCGDLTKLRIFCDTSERSVTKYTPNKITDVSEKVVLIAAEPGMGKSVLLSHLSLKTMQSTQSPQLWIVRSNLTDHSSKFLEWLKNNPARPIKISALEAVKFLYKTIFGYLSKDGAVDGKIEDVISSCLTQKGEDFDIAAGGNVIKNMTASSLLQIKLFTHFFNKGRVVLLFDGFDEISPHYNDLVVKLLKVLKDTKVKCFWLTTRPYNILLEPENQFSTFAYTLQPFLKEDQNNFLKKFWRKNMELEEFDEEKANVFIDELVNQFSKTANDPDRKFTSIPLQIRMLADALSVKFKKSPVPFWENKADALVNKLDLVTLYEEFLENKLNIEWKKIISKKSDRDKSGALLDEEAKRSQFRRSHEIFAVFWRFEVDKKKHENVLTAGELENIKELKAMISEAKIKSGVIIDDEPKFIHRTFAEYFSAQFIWKKFISNVELEEFKEKIVRYTVVEMLIGDGAIQVSKFLALIAKKDFCKSNNLSKWENKMEILLLELTNQIDKCSVTKKDNFQSIKWLLGIIEFFLQEQKEEDLSKIMENYSKLIEKQSPKLLCVCAEMGYTILVRTLTNLNTELLNGHLWQIIWPDSPLWLAAKNNHSDFMIFLKEKFSYNVKWADKDGKCLIYCIFREDASNVLKSCLELNIIDCGPFIGEKCLSRLPIYEALERQFPVEVIELLIKQTDTDIMNLFIHHSCKFPESHLILEKLLGNYDKPMEIIKLAIEEGIDFSFCLNDVLCSFKLDNVLKPHILDGWQLDSRFVIGSSCFIHRYPNFQNLSPFPIIQQLLKAGAGYSYIDARRGLDRTSDSTYHIVKQMHDMDKLINEIYNLHKQNSKENDDPRQMLFRLFFNYIKYLGFKALEITIDPNEIRILPHYQEKCEEEDKFRILSLIFRVIRKCKYFDYHEDCLYKEELDIIQNTMCISIPKKELLFNAFCDSDLYFGGPAFPGFKHFMTKLFFEHYIDDDSDLDLMKSTVDELKKCVLEENSARPIPVNDSSYVRYKSDIYEKCKQFHVDSKNKLSREFFNERVKSLLCDILVCNVLHLHFDQHYKITDAFDEISEKVTRLEEAFNKLLKMKKKSSSEQCEHSMLLVEDQILDILGLKNTACEHEDEQCEHSMLLVEDQILDILGLKNTACEHEDLQKLVPKISEILTGDLIDICCGFNQICQQKVIPVLEQCLEFSDESKRIFDLFEKLHKWYENLISAVEKNDIDKVTSALQNVELDFVKAIIHGQDEHYGSPLHYAALNGQADIINIFLDHGANPNLRLCNNFEKITHFSQAVEKMKKYPSSDDFVNWSPLYFAVLNDHLEVVQRLMERGADVNHVLNPGQGGYSPLHISALSGGSLEVALLLLKNGARYNARNKKCEIPLEFGTSGSHVKKLLTAITKLFHIVKGGKISEIDSEIGMVCFDLTGAALNAKNTDDKTRLEFTENNKRTSAINSVFEMLDFELWETVLNAKNIDDETLSNVAKNNGWEDIVELLSEKSLIVCSVKLVELHEGYENLICAVKEDDTDKVRSVLENKKPDFVKAIINHQDKDYGSPLHYAALIGRADIINIFLDHGVNPNLRLWKNFEKITDFPQAVEKMRKDPFWSDDFLDWTPLYFAVLNNQEQVVEILIDKGADVNHDLIPYEDGYSPLHILALSCGSLKIAQLLFKKGARYNVRNKDGTTPLDFATSESDIEKLLGSIDKLFNIVKVGGSDFNAINVFEMLDFDSQKAVLNAKNTDDDKTLLELTENNAWGDIFKLLSEKLLSSVDLVKLYEGRENLFCAVKENNITKVRRELQDVEQHFVKAIIHGRVEHYGSPLHYAALIGRADIINVFLDRGANPNLRLCNNFKKTAHFLQAVEKKYKGLSLIDDFINWTPLHFAVLNDHLEVVQILIARGADVNHVLNWRLGGYSPLHVSALSCGSVKIAQLLLKNGARYNDLNKADYTPLELATSGSDVEKLLRSIDDLFRIVREGTNAADVSSVFEVLDFDSCEAVLNAKNTIGKTLLELTNNDAQKDIFELLSAKLRLTKSRGL